MARRRMHTQQDEARLEEDSSALQEEAMTAMARPADFWLESQAALYRQFDDIARRWLDRRREALDATRQSIDEMRRSSDMGEVFRIQQEWITGSMRRIAADFSEFSGAAMNFTQAASQQLGRSAEGAAQDADQMGRDILSAAGSKPSSAEESES
jgi:Phasin protein